ncbi:MAG: glycosyl hydrolase-related protein [Ardenticatenaceae bacterium]|nr:glycosyl hydrolase-related protein [Ardenticatenaceae bacterium]
MTTDSTSEVQIDTTEQNEETINVDTETPLKQRTVDSSETTGNGTEPKTQFKIFVYHHTHWDREWWATQQDFRIRLLELIDELLEVLDRDPEFRCFLLDGQTIVLKDYLEIRPENTDKLVNYINANRIQCGPWYILPDEFLVSGEAHIRNFWLGERVAERLGIQNLNIGYLPDTFGHISQMPQILRGFGIDNAMIWRGVGGDPQTAKTEFLWEAADDSQVLTHWFPDGYYVVGFEHFDNPQKTDDDTYGRIRKYLEGWAARATTDCLLMPYGGDHLLIDKRLPRLLKQVNESIQDFGGLSWATTQEYFDAVRERHPHLQRRKGERREFGLNYPHLLPGVLSTRLYLKQLNVDGQMWLERYAEPFSALAWRHGRQYDASLLWTAWEYLVQNHPHDSICGCSIDQVHKEMIPRFDQSRQIAQIVTEKSVRYINAQVDTSRLEDDEEALVVHNPLPWTRTGPVDVLIHRKKGIHPRTHVLRDSEGHEVPLQVKDVERVLPLTNQWQYTQVRFVATDVPALGHQTYRLGKRQTTLDQRQMFVTTVQAAARLKGSLAVTDLRVGEGVLENRFLRVEVNRRDGRLSMTDKGSGERYDGLNAFEDGGDAGDEYSYAAPLNDMVLRSNEGARVHVSIAEAGYASATLRIDLDWALPTALFNDRLSRQSEYVDSRISTFVTLASQSKRVEIRTEWENHSKDHRLRVLFPLGTEVSVSQAEGQFDVVERRVRSSESGNGWQELAVATMPQQGYVSVNSGARGLTIANKGLPEFEVLPDGQGTVAVTILRAVGWLSREDIPVRVGGAGPQMPTPDAQCLGRQQVEYAIVPHAGAWLEAQAYRTVHEYLAPFYGSVTDRHAGTLPETDGLLEIEGDHRLLLSACKKAERSDALILRFWNVASTETEVRIRLRERPSGVRLVNLKEEPLEEEGLALDEDGAFRLRAGPAKIVTVAIEFEEEDREELPQSVEKGDRQQVQARKSERSTTGRNGRTNGH